MEIGVFTGIFHLLTNVQPLIFANMWDRLVSNHTRPSSPIPAVWRGHKLTDLYGALCIFHCYLLDERLPKCHSAAQQRSCSKGWYLSAVTKETWERQTGPPQHRLKTHRSVWGAIWKHINIQQHKYIKRKLSGFSQSVAPTRQKVVALSFIQQLFLHCITWCQAERANKQILLLLLRWVS